MQQLHSQVHLLRAESLDDLKMIRSEYIDTFCESNKQPMIDDVKFDGSFYTQEIAVDLINLG